MIQRHFRARAEGLAQWPRLVASFAFHDQLKQIKGAKDRERKLSQLIATTMGSDADLEMMRNMGAFVELFMGGQIVVRQFPCGVHHPAFAFVGALLDRAGYLQEERESLFAKYGHRVADWDMVFQIAAIPADVTEEPDLNAETLVDVSGRISREQFEDLAVKLMQMFEAMGVSEAPTFPSISVTPIAIFRELPHTTDSE